MEFIRSYKDENYIYFLTEFIKGMELFDAIRVIGLLNS
jgi:cGMP-dependent protein kinase